MTASWMDPVESGRIRRRRHFATMLRILTHSEFRDEVRELYGMLDSAFPRKPAGSGRPRGVRGSAPLLGESDTHVTPRRTEPRSPAGETGTARQPAAPASPGDGAEAAAERHDWLPLSTLRRALACSHHDAEQ